MVLFHKNLFNFYKMELKIIDYGGIEYQKMTDLRTKILRTPLGLTYTEEYLLKDKEDILMACLENEEMIGCCILTVLDTTTIQLRQIAVLDAFQKKGIGTRLVELAEKIAKEKSIQFITLHARKVVADFYLKLGYQIEGDEFVEVNIPHLQMTKMID
jgi:predicted GNAT family N-acyltransferase